ncbi:hypothetical protein XPA_010453 [Xanthoria parietina]
MFCIYAVCALSCLLHRPSWLSTGPAMMPTLQQADCLVQKALGDEFGLAVAQLASFAKTVIGFLSHSTFRHIRFETLSKVLFYIRWAPACPKMKVFIKLSVRCW